MEQEDEVILGFLKFEQERIKVIVKTEVNNEINL